jgi:hypothetical protein
MTGKRRNRNGTLILLSPADVAKALGCSEWWVKEQARRRRIPFSWIGGSYRFTDEHLQEIIRAFEHRPTAAPTPARTDSPPVQRRRRGRPALQPATRLRARTPGRARRAAVGDD